MYYKVTLLNNSMDKSEAEIVPYNNGSGGLELVVYSSNTRMKAHLEQVLAYEAYIIAPGKSRGNLVSDGVMHLYPNTLEYVQALPEILSWRGYLAMYVEDVHKSIDILDAGVVIKSVSGDNGIYTNAKGERVVKVVPKGYIAVHTDGRVVAAGKWINANIDKEDSEWVLEENPYEDMPSEKRKEEQGYMDMYLEDYHPGVKDELYKKRETEDDDFHYEEGYTPTKPTKRLSDFVTQDASFGEAEVDSSGVEKHLPVSIPKGKILYSPDSGYVFESSHWPPKGIDGYEKMRWFVFEKSELSDEQKKKYSKVLGIKSPSLAVGIDKGPQLIDKDLNTSDGFRLSIPGFASSAIVINAPSGGKLKREDLSGDKDYQERVKKASRVLEKIKEMTAVLDSGTGSVGLSGELDKLEIEDLRGMEANFVATPFAHQKAGILALVEPSQYEVFGGPKGWHGHFLNWTYGLGKTAIVTAADAIMRNRGVFESGRQVTIVTAPNKNVFVWKDEIGKFRDEDAIVIDGDRSNRIEQWETLLTRARNNELPSFVVVGSSKFRFNKNEEDFESPEDAWELSVDAQYMKLLSLGGSSNDVPVKGNHVSAMVIDESGQYVNSGSARHSAVMELTEAIYQGGGLTWTLNGDISGNSSSDTVSEVAFINKFARDNYIGLVEEYTKPDQYIAKRSKSQGRRVWKDINRLREFAKVFRPQIFSLNGKTVAGDKYGMARTEDSGAPIGANWGVVYNKAYQKLVAGSAAKKLGRTLGLLQIMVNSSMGAVSAARLIEYDLGIEKIIKGVSKLLPAEEYASFRENIINFQRSTTEELPMVGRVAASIGIPERDKIFNQMFSESQRVAMEKVLEGWDAPVLDQFVDGVMAELSNQAPGENAKIGVAGFSKTAMRAIHKRLIDRLDGKALIQIIDGDTTPEEVSSMQTRHQNESDLPVISIVTSAGLYGLSLPSSRTFRLPTWNSAKGGQYDGRFHRDAEQENLATVIVPDGVCQYMRELENTKRDLELDTRGAVLDLDDSGDELTVSGGVTQKLVEKLAMYAPRILKKESGDS